MYKESTVVCKVVCKVDGSCEELRYKGRQGENKLRGCFIEEGIVINSEGRENAGTVES